ncbi:MAG: hypothetical protein ACKO8J_00535, partial [Candidatus Limnocylindrus sp.]
MSSAQVCPFLALATDSSKRLPIPHITHACFAERPAQPIELEHQGSNCLSATFTSCPAFVAWAAREAAQPLAAAAPLSTEELAAVSRGSDGDVEQHEEDGTIWSTAGLAAPSGVEADDERARVLPLHR